MMIAIDDGIVINCAHVRKLEPMGACMFEITWSDGTREAVLDSAGRLGLAQEALVPAPPGFSVLAIGDEVCGIPLPRGRQPVVAFRVSCRGVDPVTVDDGRGFALNNALVFPDGRCRDLTRGTIHNDAEEWERSCQTR